MKTKIIYSFALLTLLFSNYSFSQTTKTWTGSAGTSNWGDALNWNNSTLPASSDSVVIPANVAITVSSNVNIKSICFTPNANTSASVTINSGVTFSVSDYFNLPRGNSNNNRINSVYVAGNLNVGKDFIFSNSGQGQRHILSISTGNVVVNRDIITAQNTTYNTGTGANAGWGGIGTGSAKIEFTGSGTLKMYGKMFTGDYFTTGNGEGTMTCVAGSTVEYAGGAQTIQNFDYTNLILSGSGTKTYVALNANNATTTNNKINGTDNLFIRSGVDVSLPQNNNNPNNTNTTSLNYRKYVVQNLFFGSATSSVAVGYWGGSSMGTVSVTGAPINKTTYASYFGSSAGYFYVASGALPVTLTSFTAKAGLNNTVNLAWATSSEIVNKGFRIERQSAIGNGKFENIGFVASKAPEGGNSSVPLYYSFADVAPANNATNYYRLAQVDLDGKTTYSDVRLVRIGGEAVTMVYPNPSNGVVNISRSSNASKMNVQILDMSGRMVQQFSNVSDANFQVNISKAGMYNVKMINVASGEQTIQRIVVQK